MALTFDDGPWPNSTAQLLTILTQHQAPATVFVVGRQPQRYPELVRQQLAAGMAAGSPPTATPALRPAPGGPPPRPAHPSPTQPAAAGGPPGRVPATGRATSPAVTAAAQELGDRTVLWSVDPADWQPSVTADQLTQRGLTAARPGAIVRLHDGGENRSATVAALPASIDGLRRLGLTLTIVPT